MASPEEAAIALSASMSHGVPNRCTGSSAAVRGVTAARTEAGSSVNVASSTSASTGVAPR